MLKTDSDVLARSDEWELRQWEIAMAALEAEEEEHEQSGSSAGG